MDETATAMLGLGICLSHGDLCHGSLNAPQRALYPCPLGATRQGAQLPRVPALTCWWQPRQKRRSALQALGLRHRLADVQRNQDNGGFFESPASVVEE